MYILGQIWHSVFTVADSGTPSDPFVYIEIRRMNCLYFLGGQAITGI
jgi:hypothetical protein